LKNRRRQNTSFPAGSQNSCTEGRSLVSTPTDFSGSDSFNVVKYIQGDSGEKVNILGSYSIVHCQKKKFK
jgi:hypothetical protein